MYQIFYSEDARNDLRNLDQAVAKRIVKKIEFFGQQDNVLTFAKVLADFRIGSYRFRIGQHRVIFDIDSFGKLKILKILRIMHRKDVYDL
mgnify:CR=1 FL=1